MMRYITVLSILSFACLGALRAQSPHGEAMQINCAACHSPDSWQIAYDDQLAFNARKAGDPQRFNHAQTGFPLEGGHAVIDCRSCHEPLLFEQVNPSCISCHTDLHQMTVGNDCARCHSTSHWLVDNVMELHLSNGFPLLGNHATADCRDCHQSETVLRFDRIGNDCFNCHLQDYQATTSPDHEAAGYSLNCMDCHDMAAPDWRWSAGAANHLFFPLTGGHDINDCNKCHLNGNFTNTPTECVACHLDDFNATVSPDHEANNFPTDCALCHNTDPGWSSQDFSQHDQLYFPIFSGEHRGAWNDCVECHTSAGNFKSFSCIDCHEHNDPGDLADEHDDVSGYKYESQSCYACHPKGSE